MVVLGSIKWCITVVVDGRNGDRWLAIMVVDR